MLLLPLQLLLLLPLLLWHEINTTNPFSSINGTLYAKIRTIYSPLFWLNNFFLLSVCLLICQFFPPDSLYLLNNLHRWISEFQVQLAIPLINSKITKLTKNTHIHTFIPSPLISKFINILLPNLSRILQFYHRRCTWFFLISWEQFQQLSQTWSFFFFPLEHLLNQIFRCLGVIWYLIQFIYPRLQQIPIDIQSIYTCFRRR